MAVERYRLLVDGAEVARWQGRARVRDLPDGAKTRGVEAADYGRASQQGWSEWQCRGRCRLERLPDLERRA